MADVNGDSFLDLVSSGTNDPTPYEREVAGAVLGFEWLALYAG